MTASSEQAAGVEVTFRRGCGSDDEFHGDPEHAEYHRQRGDLLRGYLPHG